MQYLRMKTDSQLSGTQNDNKDRLQNGLGGGGQRPMGNTLKLNGDNGTQQQHL